MKRFAMPLAALLAASFLAAAPARAADPPAVVKAPESRKAELRERIAAAIKEGMVAYNDTVIQPATNDALSEAFRKYYGLPDSFKVSYQTMAPANLIPRFEQELRANRVTIDVGSIGSPPWAFARAKEGAFMQYESPEYAAYQKAFELKLGKPGYFAFNGAYYFVPMWNEETLKFDGDSWTDVLKVAKPGRVSTSDASRSDPTLMTYMGLRKVIDKSFFEKYAEFKPSFSYKSENTASRLISGEDILALIGMPTRAYQFNARGAKLKFMRPKEGVVVIPQNTFIFKDAPHPNAAKLWLDFILSEEGQTILAGKEYLMSGRSGFKHPVKDYPTIENTKSIAPDYEHVTHEEMQKYRDEYRSIFFAGK
ncbi:MAG TPA: extracellular solute-binding protein [Xanthobacteraceae bacterium]|nr:extracellular solute-binding protein [Xanthobacteraceae bacterium]